MNNCLLGLALTPATLVLLAGCSSQTASSTPGSPARPIVTPNATVTLDGDISEWPAEAALLADENYIYFRVTVQDSQWTLQAGPETIAVLIDSDGNRATGRIGQGYPTDQLGADLEIQFSPIDPKGGQPRRGATVYALGRDGARTPIPSADAQLSFLPTYAAKWYEGRISRRIAGPVPVAAPTTPLTGVAVLLGKDGQIEGWSDPSSVYASKAATTSPLASVEIPAKPHGAIRVVSWNVLKNGPVNNPEPFARVIEALQPDAILLQEWDEGDAAAIQGWFTALVPGDSAWQAVKGYGGVVIVSRYPVVPVDPGKLETPNAEGKPSEVRFVAATIGTPQGELTLGSTHLKCCGFKDSPEDRQRMDQARAINTGWQSASPSPARMRIICGDMNLVGSRPPLDLLRAGLDADGSDLSVAEPFVLGDRTQYTWSDYKTEFTPGRLDYYLYSDSTMQVYQSFVLDTTRLAEEPLARVGLRRADTDASDHKPLVIDLMPTGQ